MFDLLSDMLNFPFLTRALIVGGLIALCASLLGVSLVLKRYSMIGDGLSHVGFGSLAVATALNAAPMQVALPVVIAAAFLMLRLSEKGKIKGDAIIALISTGSLALGIMVMSLTTGMNVDVYNFLFGSILAMAKGDVLMSVILSIIVLGLYVLFYTKIFAITFDESFAKATGIKTDIYNLLIALLTAVTVVLGMRLMGALLISSLIIFPSLTSMRVFKSFRSVVISSGVLSVVCFFVGILISFAFATPVGASIVTVNIITFILFSIVGLIKSKIKA